jgi:hypothetical protein
MLRNKTICGVAVLFAAMIGVVSSQARPNTTGVKREALLKSTAAGCDPATATVELDINNVRARLMTGGDMWWDQGTSNAAYEVPKGTKKNSLFAGSVWVGGFTADKQLKVCAQTYRQDGNDYWPGPLSGVDHSIDQATCAEWDRFWKVDRETINRFRELSKSGIIPTGSEFQTIWEWPANGNGISTNMNANDASRRAKGTSGNILNMDDAHDYAPYVETGGLGNDLTLYNPEKGDYPGDPLISDLWGDQFIWWIFNDKGNAKNQSKTESIGMEVQVGAFGYSSKDFMNDATFYNYRLINFATSNLDSTFMATWTDADLGFADDDYIGCDTIRGLGILYNGKAVDGTGQVNSYGSNVPMVGVDFFRGPRINYIDSNGISRDSSMKMTAFTYYNNSADPRIGNPSNGVQIYNYMTGTSRNGQNFNNDYQGPGVASNALNQGPDTRFVFFGDPDKDSWSECICANPTGDRRFIHSAGPFVLTPGNVSDVTIGVVWTPGTGGCPNTNFRKIRLADDQAQALFDNGFKTIEGPEAPLLVKREMDQRIIFYLTNPSVSTNFQEKFGYQVDSSKYRVASIKAKNAKNADSLYKFEGYRVFQLKNSEITPAQIFGENGEVDKTVAVEVFQADIQNGIKQVVNWPKNINIEGCDSCYTPVSKVIGRDSGIRHSFEITQDAFAKTSNKNLINYKTYYFVAIAYATNNFAPFTPVHPEISQDVVYMESSHGPGSAPIQVVSAMPNPFSNDVETELNAAYGDGVIIKKLFGTGNGGNDLQLDEASEAQAMTATLYQSVQPTYKAGKGPVDIKVIDPVKVPKGNWTVYIRPDPSKPGTGTLPVTNPTFDPVVRLKDSTAQWLLIKEKDENSSENDTIYSERNLAYLNEQIIAKYGLSVSIKQTTRPGDDKDAANGYITSDLTFADPSIAWLAGVNDGEQRSIQNWIRSGGATDPVTTDPEPICNFSDAGAEADNPFDPFQAYEKLLANYTFTYATWAPYALGATGLGAKAGYELRCGPFVITKSGAGGLNQKRLYDLQSVDIVFTADKSKWTKCAVLEMNEDESLSEGKTSKFRLRSHKSWTGDVDGQGNPIYSTIPKDTGMSYFPGYAINQETGERLNMAFSEDSYLGNHNGKDLLWNPTSTVIDNFGNAIFGGRHFVYVSNTRYAAKDSLINLLAASNANGFFSFIWAGMPTINEGFSLRSLNDGLIPTETRLRLRVQRPYARYNPPTVDTNVAGYNHGFPWYQFNTNNLAPQKLADANIDPDERLQRINVVPNPYYAYSGYEANRLDTRVRIINLPRKATVSIYSLDGSLVRRLDKDNETSFIDWDIRSTKGLPIASGMYLMHVNAEGIGEKILRWFGAMRPVDITTY